MFYFEIIISHRKLQKAAEIYVPFTQLPCMVTSYIETSIKARKLTLV